jgi:hypothetical protein
MCDDTYTLMVGINTEHTLLCEANHSLYN